MVKKVLTINRWVVVYYVLLTMAVFFLSRPSVELSMAIRIGLLGLIIAPVFYNNSLLPCVLLLFCGIDAASFTAILPSNEAFIFLIILVLYFLYNRKSNFVPSAFCALSFFLVMAMLHIDFGVSLLWIIAAILISDMIKNKQDLQLLVYMFMFLSIFLSLLFLVHRGEFSLNYGTEGLERARWINPNVYGAEIAAGGVLAFAYIINALKFEKTLFSTVLGISTILLSLTVLIMNASRGSVLAFLVPVAFMFFTSKTKLYIKILVVVAFLGFAFWLFNQGIFDLLLYRIETDDTGGTGNRYNIWVMKLQYFLQSENLFNYILGVGRDACINYGYFNSTHNDFVTALIAYGLIGLVLFLYFIFIYPVRIADKNNKLNIIAILLYLLVECCVLEPLFRGYLVEIMFYFFVLKYVMIMKKEAIR